MSRRPLDALATVLLALSASARAADSLVLPSFSVADRLMPADPMPERETRWPDGTVTMTDVVYATIPGFRPLHLDLYRPTAIAGPRPLIVFVHGGGWANANPRAGAAFTRFPDVLANLAGRGYVVASIEFRFSSEAPFPAQLEDEQMAIRFLRANAARFGIDGSKVGAWGMSAGAQLAALNAVNCSEGTCVQGFVGWFGPYDLNAYARDATDDSRIRALFRCEADCEPVVLAAASPIGYVDGKDPPMLLIHGTDDRAVLPSQAQAFEQRLREAGVPVDLLLIPAAGHGFICATPAATRDALRQALTATFEFFDRLFSEPRGPQPAER
jgi:acetyl esterase/lipase